MKKEIPILFSTPMVEALIAGRKTQTRRIMKPQPEKHGNFYEWAGAGWSHEGPITPVPGHSLSERCPYGKPGDELYVRENWRLKMWDFEDAEVRIEFQDKEEVLFELPIHGDGMNESYEWMVKQVEKLTANDILTPDQEDEESLIFTDKHHPFSPSIHLPKWCSRIWLELADVRVERLQDISEEDAVAEGVMQNPDGSWYDYLEPNRLCQDSAKTSFQSLWMKINGDKSWEANPWIWAMKFEVVSTTA